MNRLKIGIGLSSLGLPLRQALPQAQRLGVRGVQLDAVGDLSPHTLSQTGRRAFRHLLSSHGLALTALGCPLRRGLDNPEDQQQRIEHIEGVLGLSVDLGAGIAIVQAGRVPETADDPRALLLAEALRGLGRYGERIGAVLAVETGLESGTTLSTFLDRCDTRGLGVNLDPASLLLHEFDARDSTRALQDKIVHARATDVRGAGRSAQSVPLGQGDVDWVRCLGVLEEIGYRGWLSVESAGSGNRVTDVAAGISFLERRAGAPSGVNLAAGS